MARVYDAPELTAVEAGVLKLIEDLREQLRSRVHDKPRRWVGHLRRMAFARAVQASNSIEGYDASLDDVVAAVDDEPTHSADEETRYALAGYRDAMTYVLQVAQDPDMAVDEGLLKSLHFMMLKHRLDKNPGRWRPGAVPELIAATVKELEASRAPVLVRAAMAHLNLVMVHPFSDGNGRMARCLQTLVLAREQIVAPVFSSIEEYLGRNTEAYYAVLGEVGQGGWNPQHDARPWVRFCLNAHYHQARTQLRRIEESERLYVACCELAQKHGLPERTAGALAEAAYGFRLRNSSYRAVVEITSGEELSELTASRDLRALVDARLFKPIGKARGRYYVAQAKLRAKHEEIRADRVPKETDDPFEIAVGQLQLAV